MTRILLVEGNEKEARALGKTLATHRGWDVVRASTLMEAIRAAGDNTFDAAVLDADLPDGSGLDILDFLRIGSPGIRIMLLADKSNEQVAFHALSHGAGDFMLKDKHLESELPRRIDALLEHDHAMGALVETLTAVQQYDAPEFRPTPPVDKSASAVERALKEIVGGSVLAAGLWDLRGKPVAIEAPPDVDADGIGFAMGTLHGQIGALWTYGNLKPTGYRLMIDIEGGLLAITAIPGTYIVAILLDSGFAPRRATERLDQAGIRVLAALQGGGSGHDIMPAD